MYNNRILILKHACTPSSSRRSIWKRIITAACSIATQLRTCPNVPCDNQLGISCFSISSSKRQNAYAAGIIFENVPIKKSLLL